MDREYLGIHNLVYYISFFISRKNPDSGSGYGGNINGGPNNLGGQASNLFGAAFGYAIQPNYDSSGAGGGYFGGN